MLLLDMAYRLLREFRQAFTRLDTPPFPNRRHPDSDIARTKGSYYRDKYNRLRARHGPVRTIMVIPHKLLVAAFHMVSTGEAFRALGEGYLDQVERKRSATKLVQRLSNLEHDVIPVPKAA